jgi:hypothetical protein
MSRTRRDQARGRQRHPTIPHVYRKPQSAAEAMYPNLPSDQQLRDRDRDRVRDRDRRKEKP